MTCHFLLDIPTSSCFFRCCMTFRNPMWQTLFKRFSDSWAMMFLFLCSLRMAPCTIPCRHGAILDSCITDEERQAQVMVWRQAGTFPASLRRVTQSKATGNQTIYRAELQAVTLVCKWTVCAHINTDSASVLDTFHKCLEAAHTWCYGRFGRTRFGRKTKACTA